MFPHTRLSAPENRRGETIDLKRTEPLAPVGKDVTVSNDGSALRVDGQCPLCLQAGLVSGGQGSGGGGRGMP